MSQSTAKATRREIRRAVGAHGLDAVNQTTVVVYDHLIPAYERFDAHIRMTLLQRLRWLLKGDYE